jgi:hypothetical protein
LGSKDVLVFFAVAGSLTPKYQMHIIFYGKGWALTPKDGEILLTWEQLRTHPFPELVATGRPQGSPSSF